MSVIEVKELTKIFKISEKNGAVPRPGMVRLFWTARPGTAAFPGIVLLAVWIEVLFRDWNIASLF